MKRYHYVDQLVFSYLTWDDLLNNVSLINIYFHKIIENMEIKKIQLHATKWAKHYYYLDAEHHIIFSDDHYIIFNHKNLTFQYYHHVLQPYHITPSHHLVGFLTSIEYEQKGFGRWQIYNPDKRKKKNMTNKKKDCPFKQINFDPKSTIPFIILSGALIEKQTKVDFLHPRIVPINRKKNRLDYINK